MAIRLGTLVAEVGQAGTGVNAAVRGIVSTHDGEIEAFVKRLGDVRELLVEIACSHIARGLGLPVPEPLLVFVPEHLGGPQLAFGSASIGHPNVAAFLAQGDHAAVIRRLKDWRHLVQAACFDEWIANCDRHPGNMLYNGDNEFWLIDHGLAVHQVLAADSLAPENHLFKIAVQGLSEEGLLKLKPQAVGVMQTYSAHDTQGDRIEMPPQVWNESILDSVFDWLAARQNHLVRLGGDRIPVRQREIFDGNRA